MGREIWKLVHSSEFLDLDCSDEGIGLENMKPVTIELRDVSFQFCDDGPYILRHINLVLHESEKIAFVGENGAGKSTLGKDYLRAV